VMCITWVRGERTSLASAHIQVNASQVRTCIYTHIMQCVCTERKPTCAQLCLRVLSQRVWKEKANSQSNKRREQRGGEKRWDCSWLWAWQQMCYTNPARCIQAVSMAMERVIVELRRAPPRPPPRWTQAPGPHRRCLAPSGGRKLADGERETQRRGATV